MRDGLIEAVTQAVGPGHEIFGWSQRALLPGIALTLVAGAI